MYLDLGLVAKIIGGTAVVVGALIFVAWVMTRDKPDKPDSSNR
jgi:hypothetical protein